MAGAVFTIKETCCPVKPSALQLPADRVVSDVMGWSGDLQGSPPPVIRAGSQAIEFPSSTVPLCMVYDYESMDMMILVALVKRS